MSHSVHVTKEILSQTVAEPPLKATAANVSYAFKCFENNINLSN